MVTHQNVDNAGNSEPPVITPRVGGRKIRSECIDAPLRGLPKIKHKSLTQLMEQHRELDRLSAEVQEYENFFDDLRNSSEFHRADWIKVLLEKVCLIALAI